MIGPEPYTERALTAGGRNHHAVHAVRPRDHERHQDDQQALCGVVPAGAQTPGGTGAWRRTGQRVDCLNCQRRMLPRDHPEKDNVMAQATTSTITITTLQVALPLPTNAGELDKAIGMMRSQMTSHGLHVSTDTAFRVETDGESLLLRAEITGPS